MDDDGSQQREVVFPQEEAQCGIMGPEKKSSLQRLCSKRKHDSPLPGQKEDLHCMQW